MKQFKKLLFAFVLVASTSFVANAQNAHINSEELIAAMPETKAMGEELKKLGQSYDADYKSQVNALQVKAKAYQEQAVNQPNEINEARQKEITEIQQKLQLYMRTAQEELQKKEYNLLKPIVDKAKKAIEDVAAAKGIKYVFDSSAGKGLIVFTGEDLMPAVKAKLGI
jgi:outer membrane protein